MGEYLLEVKNLKKTYPIYRNTGKLFGSKERMNAVDGMSFYIKKGGSNEDRQFRKRKQKICQNCK